MQSGNQCPAVLSLLQWDRHLSGPGGTCHSHFPCGWALVDIQAARSGVAGGLESEP